MSRQYDCIYCGRELEADINNIARCPICTKNFTRRQTKIPIDNVIMKYETLYQVLNTTLKEMLTLQASKDLDKNKRGFNKGITAIETLISFMENKEQ